MKSFVFGHSTENVPILAHSFGYGDSPLLILGAHHGDEVEGSILSLGLIDVWLKNYDYNFRTVIVPTMNIDGQLKHQRWNARNVDLNRNLPTKDWTPKILNPRYPPGPHAASEVESQALLNWLKKENPRFILSLHSYHPMVLVNGPCEEEARILGQWTGYQVKEDVGYPTPGSLGDYAGHDLGIPTITYEIERGLAGNKILDLHLPAVREMMKHLEAKNGN